MLCIYYPKPNRNGLRAITASLLQKNPDYEIKFITKNLQWELAKLFKKHKKIILAISFFSTQAKEIFKIVKDLKNTYGDKLIIIGGGPHASALPENTLRRGFDYIIKGEGEISFPKLIEKLKKGEEIKEKIIQGEKVQNLDDFYPFVKKYGKYGAIEITRGCPWGCKFCQTTYLFGRDVRHRSIEKICDLVCDLLAVGITDIRFITPNALSYGTDGFKADYNMLYEFLKSVRDVVKRRGRIFFGNFPSEVRPDFLTEDIALLLKEFVDNQYLIIGAQTGSDSLLEKIGRGHTVSDVYTAVQNALKAGFTPHVDFMFGLPGETQADRRKTVRVMEELSGMGARIHAHTFMPLPGTPFQNAKLNPIDNETKSALGRLAGQGVLYGQWQTQEKLAHILKSLY